MYMNVQRQYNRRILFSLLLIKMTMLKFHSDDFRERCLIDGTIEIPSNGIGKNNNHQNKEQKKIWFYCRLSSL